MFVLDGARDGADDVEAGAAAVSCDDGAESRPDGGIGKSLLSDAVDEPDDVEVGAASVPCGAESEAGDGGIGAAVRGGGVGASADAVV